MASNGSGNGNASNSNGNGKKVAKSSANGSASSGSKGNAASNGNGSNGSNGNGSNSNGAGGMLMAPPPPPTLANGRLQSTASPDKGMVLKLLGPRTRNYRGPLERYTDRVLGSEQPIFMRYFINAMMRDPDVKYGLEMLCGPIISKAKYLIKASDPEIQEYVDRQVKRFWLCGAPVSLRGSLKFGYSGSEVLFRWNNEHGFLEFDKLKYIHPNDIRPVLVRGAMKGCIVKRIRDERRAASPFPVPETNSVNIAQGAVYLGLPKCFWTVNERERHRWYGASRLEGAFLPWYETWQPQGFRGIRHGWFYKNAYDSGFLQYPKGATPDPDTGIPIPNVLIAQEILDRRETGAGIAVESAGPADLGGWNWTPPMSNPAPDGLADYGEDLRDDKWKGIGVPPEVAKAEQTGSFAGRRVPQQAFYSFLQEIANYQLFDFDEQVLQFLVKLNYGPEASYEIEPVPILVTLQQEEMGSVTGHLPGDPNDPFYNGGGAGTGGGVAQSGGRVEDRDSNGFNMAEQQQAAN